MSQRQGLLIKDKLINKISGPVSFFILTPNSKGIEKCNTKLPIFFLFGDVHGSDSNLCKDCNCSVESCCHFIADKDFLQTIDSIATKEFPIDINIEKEFFKISAYNEINTFFGKFHLKQFMLLKLGAGYEMCYLKDMRGTKEYDYLCPTKEVKWHFVDVRKTESKYFLDKKLSLLFYKDYLPDKKFILQDLFNPEISFPAWINSLEQLKIYCYENKTLAKFLLNFCIPPFDEAIKTYLDPNKNPFYKNSLVMKELSRLSGCMLEVNWDEIIFNYLKTDYMQGKREKSLKNLFVHYQKSQQIMNLKNIFAKISDWIGGEEINLKELYEKAKNNEYFLYMRIASEYIGPEGITARFLDLYYVLRALKKPVGSNQAFLSIGAFGHAHVRMIVELLTKLLGYYQIEYENDKYGFDLDKLTDFKNTNRCLEIKSFINLNKLALNYGHNLLDVKYKPPTYVLEDPEFFYPKLKLNLIRGMILGDLCEKFEQGMVESEEIEKKIEEFLDTFKISCSVKELVKLCQLKEYSPLDNPDDLLPPCLRDEMNTIKLSGLTSFNQNMNWVIRNTDPKRKVIEKHPNGMPKAIGYITDDKKIGIYEIQDENGALTKKYIYDDEGKLQSVENFENNRLKTKSAYEYDDKTKTDVLLTRDVFSDEGITHELYNRNKKLEGLVKTYGKNGNIIKTTNYINGLKDGDEVEYWSDGELKSKTIYMKGKKISSEEYTR